MATTTRDPRTAAATAAKAWLMVNEVIKEDIQFNELRSNAVIFIFILLDDKRYALE